MHAKITLQHKYLILPGLKWAGILKLKNQLRIQLLDKNCKFTAEWPKIQIC